MADSSNFPLDPLAHFDELPDSAHVRQPVVQALYACSASTLWRRVNDGGIPRPRRFPPRSIAWNVGELRRDLSSKAVSP